MSAIGATIAEAFDATFCWTLDTTVTQTGLPAFQSAYVTTVASTVVAPLSAADVLPFSAAVAPAQWATHRPTVSPTFEQTKRSAVQSAIASALRSAVQQPDLAALD